MLFRSHHQLAIVVMAEARRKGFRVNSLSQFQQIEFTRETFRSKVERIRQGQGVAGANTMAAYALFVLEAAQYEPDETTANLVEFLIRRQEKDGSWPALADRPPSEGSPFTNAALAIQALKHYGLADSSLAEVDRARVKKSRDAGIA